MSSKLVLPRNSNQARGLARFAIQFLQGTIGNPSTNVLNRTELFHTDSVLCGISALAMRTNAPTLLRDEALKEYQRSADLPSARVFGSDQGVAPEKAIVANCAAVREWDSNGTVFGYNPKLNHCAGEFGHNDFYPVVIAACQIKGLNGEIALRAMILSDEIRGRLAEVFSLKSYKIDHVVHGAISSAVVYGALLGANEEQIESALGMLIAHYIPWRAIRSGKELSDSKGSSAALSTEAAIISVHRAMKGFVGPKDIFRNKEAIFRYFQPNDSDESPFDIVLSHSGDDFAVMGMHFKLGLYEYQSASALHGLLKIISENPHEVLDFHSIKRIKIVAYEPAYGIIGDKSKWNPTNRQSADHSMVYIVSRKLMKAIQIGPEKISEIFKHEGIDGLWKALMLSPYDYSSEAISDGNTRSLMHRIEFVHGGPEYDLLYPEGIPTSIKLESSSGVSYDSGLIMFPAGHSLNSTSNLTAILTHKFQLLGKIALGNEQSSTAYLSNLSNLSQKSSNEVLDLYCAKVKFHPL